MTAYISKMRNRNLDNHDGYFKAQPKGIYSMDELFIYLVILPTRGNHLYCTTYEGSLSCIRNPKHIPIERFD